MALVKRCAAPGCGEILPIGETYCAPHAKAEQQRRWRRQAARQAAGQATGRRKRHRKVMNDAAWAELREAKLASVHWCCQWCGVAMTRGRVGRNAAVVDHWRPVAKHPELAFDLGNLVALCAHCHAKRKQRAERAGIELGRTIGETIGPAPGEAAEPEGAGRSRAGRRGDGRPGADFRGRSN